MKKLLIVLIVIACIASLTIYIGQVYPQYNVLNVFSAQEQKTDSLEAKISIKSYVESGVNTSLQSNCNIQIKFKNGNQTSGGVMQFAHGTTTLKNDESCNAVLQLTSTVSVAAGYEFDLISGDKVIGTGIVIKPTT